jgi:hypothetical protein
MSTFVNLQSGAFQQTAQIVSGSISSGGITYGTVASGAVISGTMCMSGFIFEKHIDPAILGTKGNEYWKQIGVNTHLRDSAGYSSGVGYRWYLGGTLNRHGGTNEAGISSDFEVQFYHYAVPFLAARGGAIASGGMGIYITRLSTSSGGKFQLGIYDSASSGNAIYPNALLEVNNGSGIFCGVPNAGADMYSGMLYTWSPTTVLSPGSLYWLSIAGHPLARGPWIKQVGQATYGPWGINDCFNVDNTIAIKGIYVNNSNNWSGNWPMQATFPTVSGLVQFANVTIPGIGIRY